MRDVTPGKTLPRLRVSPKLQKLTPEERRAAKRGSKEFLEAVSQEAASHVYNTMMDPNMPPDLRLRAAFDILDRSLGKATNKVEQKVLDEMEERAETIDLTAIPSERIEEALERVRNLLDPPEFDLDG